MDIIERIKEVRSGLAKDVADCAQDFIRDACVDYAETLKRATDRLLQFDTKMALLADEFCC